jgi:PAS domain S-box-containing protein
MTKIDKTNNDFLKLQRAVELSDEAVFITDPEGIITYINPGFTNMYGFNEGEVVGICTPRILKGGVMNDEDYKHFWESLLNKEVVRGELINKTKDGRLINVQASANPILNTEDEIIGYLGIQLDRTSQKKMEEALKKSEEKFRKAFMISPDAVNINRMSDGLYESINEGFTKIMGYTEEDSVGKTSIELNLWYDQEKRKDLVRLLQEKGNVENFEAEFIRKDGIIVNGLMSASIIEINNIPHILSETKDITRQKQTDRAFAFEQFLVNALMDNLPDHIYFKDSESRFVRNNRSHTRSFGLNDPGQLVGKSDFDFFTREAAQKTYEDEQSIIKTGQPIIMEEKLTRKDNTEAWFSAMKLPLRDKEGNIIGTFGISRDITNEKKAVEQLFLLANALKSTNECVSITDMNDKVLFLNKAFLETYGYTENELDEQLISIIRSPNTPSEIAREIIPATLRGGWNGELLNRKKDGTEFPVSLSTSVIKNDEGLPVALIGVANDITERKKIEEDLLQSEERFRSVAQSANDAIITVDSKGKILGWNRGAESAFGYCEKEILGLSFNLIIPEDYLNQHVKGMVRLEMRGGAKAIGKTVELTGKRKNGTVFPLDLSLSDWETSEGRFFTGIVRDISTRKRNELENQIIYEISKGFTTTSNLDELLSLIHTSLGKVVYAENCFVALYNSKTGLFSFPYFVDKFDTTPEPTAMKKSCSAYVYRTVKPYLYDDKTFDILSKQGELELVGSASPSWIGIPLQTPSGVIGVLVLQHYEKEGVYSEQDVRFLVSIGSQIALVIERKKSEEEIKLKNELLQSLNAEKDKFFSILAHDLRGPMSAFVAATQILTEDMQNMTLDEIKEIMISMKTDATNIYALLENLLEWSRLRRGVMEFNPVKLNLKETINTGIDAVSISARKKGIELSLLVPDHLEIIADSHMFETIIRNLVSNAVKFTSAGGKVTITALKKDERFTEIKICDTGIGMTADMISKLFLLNEKTSRQGTEGESSSGLGLLLCKEFVEKHEGTIVVESEVGKGSTFSFLI